MAMLDEQPVHAEGGGLLPDEGAPEEHEGGALRPEEVDNGPVIPEGWILDFRTRRLVPFVLPDDPAAEMRPVVRPRA